MTTLLGIILQSAAALIASLGQPNGDTVPDFSLTGYQWGDREIPHYKVVTRLSPPADGSDATILIQNAIDKQKKKGAILLKKGVWNVSGQIRIEKDGIVLRGEGEKTVIRATGTEQRPVIELGLGTKRVILPEKARIIGDYTPVGQMFVKVNKPSLFKSGDRVVVVFLANEKWIHDIKMDQIPPRGTAVIKQWEPSGFRFYWERIVTAVQDNKVFLEAPIVMGLDPQYGQCLLSKCSWERISESGVEDMLIESTFDPSVKAIREHGKYKGQEYMSDEAHAKTAVRVRAAEHCWIKGVTAKHFIFSLAHMHVGSKNITVQDCRSLEPISEIRGNRRYAYEVQGGELILVKNCYAEYDRHGYASGPKQGGPTVFVDCVLHHAEQEVGPHVKWANGFLYDNVVTDGQLAVQDGTNGGNGHGWRGANFYLWNCEAETFICQSPWVSAKNYAIGCVGERLLGTDYKNNLGHPQGVWVSEGKHVEPRSLYYYQLSQRKKK